MIQFISCGESTIEFSVPETPEPEVPETPEPENGPELAKHIILFIGDGMELENQIAVSRYLYGADYGLSWHSFPYHSYMSTWDVSSYNVYANARSEPLYDESTFNPVTGYDPSQGGTAPYPLDTGGNLSYLVISATDSASAATAMATGVKTDSGNICWLRNDPPDGALETIAEIMRAQKGASIGVVSSVPFSHATPAGFVSHNTSRSHYIAITQEIINTTVPDVVIGGGHPNWCGWTYISSDQLTALRSSSVYVLVERVSVENGGENLLNAVANLPEDRKLFGLFGGSDGAFDTPIPVDEPGNPHFIVNEENPSLAEATYSALMVLSRGNKPFFLMVEGGEIDWANHSNNFSRMVGAVWQLEEAVKTAIDFVNIPGDDISWKNTLLVVTSDHSTGGMRLNESMPLGKGDLPTQNGSSYPNDEVSYASFGHTNELVTISARGVCLDLFSGYEGLWYAGTRIIDNTQLFQVMFQCAGLE